MSTIASVPALPRPASAASADSNGSIPQVSSSSTSSSHSQESLVLPCRSPRRYFGSKYYKAPTSHHADPLEEQLNLHGLHRAARSPPAKLSTPRGGPSWGSLSNLRRTPVTTPRTITAEPETAVEGSEGPAAVDDSTFDADPGNAVVSVTAPRAIKTTYVTHSVPAFRHDPYSRHFSRVTVSPLSFEVEKHEFEEPSPSSQPAARSTMRPPLAPALRPHVAGGAVQSARPTVSNLQLSAVLPQPRSQQLSLTTPRDNTQATPRVTTPSSGRTGSAESPTTARSERVTTCGLSSVGETPRSARTQSTPRSDSSTPRDLPEAIDGPYRNLGGIGVQPVPGEFLHQTSPRQTPGLGLSPRVDPMVNMLPASAQGKTAPLPPTGTLHEPLMTVVDFCLYPSRAFQPADPTEPTPKKEAMVRMFIGQLPYNATEMQLAWMADAFGGGVRLHHLEMITKLDRTKRKQLPTGCFHFFVEPQHVDPLMVGLHKRVLVDDTGLWIAKDEQQDTILKAYSEQMKADRTRRFVGRPYGTVVIQHSTSTFDPDAPQTAA